MSLLRRARAPRRTVPALLALTTASVGLAATAVTPPAASAHESLRPTRTGHVYVQTNDPAGNAVIAFRRDGSTGTLTRLDQYATGGTGTGTGFGSQGSVTLSEDGRVLLAVDAGSDEVSAFRVDGDHLELIDTVGSGGDRPTSVTIDGDLVYVLNADSASIAGFELGRRGLQPIPGAVRPLSTTTGAPGQIGFTPDGRRLVVPLRAADAIDVFRVGADGVADAPVTSASNGHTPFGFAFDRRGRLVMADANAGMPGGSALSSYRVDHDGRLQSLSGPVATTQTAACWVVVTDDGRYAYTTNAGSASVSGFRLNRDGTLTRLDGGVTASTGTGPIDLALSRDSRFLYTVDGAADQISMFAVGSDGALSPVGTLTGLPAPAAGIAAS